MWLAHRWVPIEKLPADARPAHNRADLTDERSGKLVARRPVAIDIHRNVVWFCDCDCGGHAHVTVANFRAGKSKSCGCVGAERNRTRWRGREESA
jgi:hypothetical protein